MELIKNNLHQKRTKIDLCSKRGLKFRKYVYCFECLGLIPTVPELFEFERVGKETQ